MGKSRQNGYWSLHWTINSSCSLLPHAVQNDSTTLENHRGVNFFLITLKVLLHYLLASFVDDEEVSCGNQSFERNLLYLIILKIILNLSAVPSCRFLIYPTLGFRIESMDLCFSSVWEVLALISLDITCVFSLHLPFFLSIWDLNETYFKTFSFHHPCLLNSSTFHLLLCHLHS